MEAAPLFACVHMYKTPGFHKLNMEVQQCQRTFFVSHAHFCNRALVPASIWKPHPLSHVYIHVCTYIQPFTGFHKATPIDLLLLQPPGVLPLQYANFMWECYCTIKARALDLHKATSTFSKHVLVPINSQVATYNTSQHTHRPIAIPISYRVYKLLAQILMHTSILAMRVTSGSDPDCYPGRWVSNCDPVSTLVNSLYTVAGQMLIVWCTQYEVHGITRLNFQAGEISTA